MNYTTDSSPVDDSHTWHCPVCCAPITHRYGPGRKRVYCSNSCKQRAYRWRCDNGVRTRATPWLPAQRSGFNKAHAVRTPTDMVGETPDHRGRYVTLCGTFAYRSSPRTSNHIEFLPGAARSCRTCTALAGADPSWATDYPPGRIAYVGGRWDWVPYPLDQRHQDYLSELAARAA